MSSPQFGFGPGIAWITQNSDYTGAAIATPSPILVSAMQDCSLDMTAEVKELYGMQAFAIAIARGKQKLSIKLKNAHIHGRLWNAAFFGMSLTNLIYDAVFDVTGTAVPASSPYTITPVAPSSGTILFPLSVRDVNDLPLTLVTGTPATRQYAYSGGVFTFAAADASTTYYIDYRYTAASSTAQELILINPLMGGAPTFSFDLKIPYMGNVFNAHFPNCMSSGVKIATKLDDFVIPEFDLSAFAPGAASPGTLSWSQ